MIGRSLVSPAQGNPAGARLSSTNGTCDFRVPLDKCGNRARLCLIWHLLRALQKKFPLPQFLVQSSQRLRATRLSRGFFTSIVARDVLLSLTFRILGFPSCARREDDKSAHEDSLHRRESSEREKASSLHPPSRISSTLATGNSSTHNSL